MGKFNGLHGTSGEPPATRRGVLAGSIVLGAGIILGSTKNAPAVEPKPGERETMADIMHSLKIQTSPDRLYQAITTAEGIRNWWTRDASLDPVAGGTGEFGFFGRRFVVKVVIEELDPQARMKWRVTNSAWPGDIVEFDLMPEAKHTRLTFAHRGFAEADQRYASATTRWGYYLLSLKQYLETGKGTPNPDDIDL